MYAGGACREFKRQARSLYSRNVQGIEASPHKTGKYSCDQGQVSQWLVITSVRAIYHEGELG
jgi:hypothetical protein